MLSDRQIVVSEAEFEQLLSSDAVIAEFATPEEEEAYEKRDSFLIHLIQDVVRSHFGSGDDIPLVLEDWWPDHTRFLALERRHCVRPFFDQLADLLDDDFPGYRILLRASDDVSAAGSQEIGACCIYSDRVVLTERLHELIRE